LSKRDLPQPTGQNIVEVSFKNGARKDFFFMDHTLPVVTGDMIVVNSGNGYDVGRLSLTGELVPLQMKKKKVKEDRVQYNVIRKANERDLEKLNEARSIEKETMVRARVIARTLNLDMKVGDVEYQGDKRKATFYYTAEGRIDFRELVRSYAKEFRVKIEMRQIGSRQESARIGGIGSCGRELCCSTWLTDFKSVSTTAARYQYMAINQSKLSGQCGRLKCCLNYELDNYMDAISHFPEKADYIHTSDGKAKLMKIDIFKGLMYYSLKSPKGKMTVVPMDKDDVKKVIEMNKKGEKPGSLASLQNMSYSPDIDEEPDYEDVTGAVELPSKKRRNKRRNNKGSGPKGKRGGNNRPKNSGKPKSSKPANKQGENKDSKGGAPKKQGNQPKAEAGKKTAPKKRNFRKNKGQRKNDGGDKQNNSKPPSDNK
jgi:cell fate regulator YaaT (PSP1 superfamily)